MADAPKKPAEAEVEANKKPATPAPHEADAAGCHAKLEADSKLPGTTTPPEAAAAASTNTPAAGETKPGDTKAGKKPDGSDKTECEADAAPEPSLYERTIGKIDTIDEIKNLFHWGSNPSDTALAKLPKVHVEGGKPVEPHQVAAATAEVAALKPEAKPLATPADAPAATPPAATEKSILGTLGDQLAWGYHALMPDAAEQAIASAGNLVYDNIIHPVADWFGDWWDGTAQELGVQDDQTLKSALLDTDGVYTDQQKAVLDQIQRPAAVTEGLEGVDKAFEVAKANKGDGTDYHTAAGPGADAQADARIQEKFKSNTPEQLQKMLNDGFGKCVKDSVDEKTHERIQVDEAGNRRIIGPDGGITLTTKDGTIHKAKDGQETYIFGDNSGVLRLQRDANGEVRRFEVASSTDKNFIEQIGLAKSLVSFEPYNAQQHLRDHPDALVTAPDRVATADEQTKLSVGFDTANKQLVITDAEGNEWRVEGHGQDRKFFKKDASGQLQPIQESDMPKWLQRDENGHLRIGNTTIRGLSEIINRRGDGQTQTITIGDDGKVKGCADAPDPSLPADATDAEKREHRVRIDTVVNPDRTIDTTDSDGNKRHIDPKTSEITGTDSDGSPLKINLNTHEIQTRDLNQDSNGRVTINSTGTSIDRDGTITSADGRTLLNSDGSWGSGFSGDTSSAKSRAEAAQIESMASATSAKVASIGSMALSIAKCGDPNALGIMRQLAWAGIAMADAGMAACGGFGPAMVTLSLSKAYPIAALSVTGDQGRALARLDSLGIFDATTQRQAMIAGSIGSTYITPESAALHFAQERRPELRPAA